VPFCALIAERAPSGIDVRVEVRLTHEPQRADMILRRRRRAARLSARARVLRRLWRWLGVETIVEFKSLARPFRSGDLVRLWGYGVQWQTQRLRRLRPGDLTLLLIVPSLTRALSAELAWMGFSVEDLGGGYRRVHGMVYIVYIVIIDEVAVAERDAFLALFGHHPADDPKAWWWLQQFIVKEGKTMALQKLEGYRKMVKRLSEAAAREYVVAQLTPKQRLAGLAPEQRLAGLAPEQRLAGLAPEQRLAGLAPEQILLALPDDVLRALAEDYVRTLPPKTRAAIRRRTRR